LLRVYRNSIVDVDTQLSCSDVQAATPSPPPEAFLRSSYISSIIGFHNLTRALMNQFET
jgi:hypothetical protein